MTEASNLRFIIRRRDDQITALRQALAATQWGITGHVCPACNRLKTDGHAEYCKVGKALAATEPEGE